MKKEAQQHLEQFLKNNSFNYTIEEIKLDKAKQPNSKPAYYAHITTPEFTLNLSVVTNNDNVFVVNQNLLTYELTKEAFSELVEKTIESTERFANTRASIESMRLHNPDKNKNALEIRQARKNKVL